MKTFKLHVQDRNYSAWEVFETTDLKKATIDFNPLDHKLFSNDTFTFDDNTVQLVHSTVRSGTPMPGVLILHGNKTYGRKKGKLLYKCIPDDARLPCFLIPYEVKHVGFSKVQLNLYVTFSCSEWSDKHPMGYLNHVIGQVDVLDNFYEYQLYCKSLNTSIQKFQKDVSKLLNGEKKTHDEFIRTVQATHPSIVDRSDWPIFSIDPPTTMDFDDAFSIAALDDGTVRISIYISNVAVVMDSLDMWDSFSRRISTIYLPDKRRPMMPTVLSECLCSLQENVKRVAMYMDVFIRDRDIVDIKYGNCIVNLYKNFRYEDYDLLQDPNYQLLFDTTVLLSKKNNYCQTVKNSHSVVCYLMVFMNYHCAKEMLKHQTGVFRSTIVLNPVVVPDSLPEDVSTFVRTWNSSSGQYIDGAEIANHRNIRHDMLKMDAYIHITSPIRRLVDLLNMIRFQQVMNFLTFNNTVDAFYAKWINDMDYINTTMRSIRKVQCDCSLLDMCSNDKSVMEKEYEGYIFDKVSKNDGLIQYIVFIPELKMSSRITIKDDLVNYTTRQFRLYLFQDEENFKRKIRLQIVNFVSTNI